MEGAITQGSPHARVITYAEDGVVLHEDRQVLEHCQDVLKMGLAQMGLSLNEAKRSMRPTLEGAQPGLTFLGCALRQYRVGKHQAGKGPRGHRRLGSNTLIKPAKAKAKEHLAELGRLIKRGRALPQGPLLRQLNPTIRGWATDSRTGGSQATYHRLAHLLWIKLRSWARWRHPRTSIGWVTRRSWHRGGARLPFATSASNPEVASLRAHREVTMTRHGKVQGTRSPYDGDGVYGSIRQGRHPMSRSKLARLLREQRGPCRDCGLFFHHDDRIEGDHRNGNHRDSRSANLQALHGHCHHAKTREHRDSLPSGMRDKHQDTEERRARKRARSDLEQRWAE
jgi:RNA-directed DNA polymerase